MLRESAPGMQSTPNGRGEKTHTKTSVKSMSLKLASYSFPSSRLPFRFVVFMLFRDVQVPCCYANYKSKKVKNARLPPLIMNTLKMPAGTKSTLQG
jgi:hypothetical protein